VVNAPAPYGARRPPPRDARYDEPADDGWGEATPVRASYLDAQPSTAQAQPSTAQAQPSNPYAAPQAQQGTPYAASNPRVQPGISQGPSGPRTPYPAAAPRRERGLSAWAALLVLLVIAAVGGAVDTLSGSDVRGGFNIGIVVASIVAMLVVRRTSMFPVVISPPLVYAGASAAMLYLRSGGLHDKKVLLDGAANWLVYGFPAIAAATAAVLIIGGIRLITHR
jgi:hypothetical protein